MTGENTLYFELREGTEPVDPLEVAGETLERQQSNTRLCGRKDAYDGTEPTAAILDAGANGRGGLAVRRIDRQGMGTHGHATETYEELRTFSEV
jgi:hypothetical protein